MFSASEESDSVGEDPSMGQQLEGTERQICICAYKRTVQFHVSHVEDQGLLFISGYFTLAQRRREGALMHLLPSLWVSYFQCSPFLNLATGVRCPRDL